MFRPKHSYMAPPRSSQRPQHPNTMPMPAARTLRLESPMSRSTADLKELSQFDFGLGKQSSYDTSEPLFQDTFYLSSEEESSPVIPHAALSAMWAIECLSRPELAQRRDSDHSDIMLSDDDDVAVETCTATKVTFLKTGRPRKVETPIQQQEPKSRGSSISTHTRETSFSSPSDAVSRLSTPASSISEYQNISPSLPSRHAHVIETENKPFVSRSHKRNAPTSLDMIEERPRDLRYDQPPPSPFAQRKAPRAKTGALEISTATNVLPSSQDASPATPELKWRRNMFHRR